MIKRLREKIQNLSSSQKSLVLFAVVFGLIGVVALVQSLAATTQDKKTFYHFSSGIQHDVGRKTTQPGANFGGVTGEVWESYNTSPDDGYLWKGPGETIKASANPQKVTACFAIYDVGNLYWKVPANVTMDIAAENGGKVLESTTTTLSDGFARLYSFGYYPYCISETLAANTEYTGVTYRLKVNRGGIRLAWVGRTIETETNPVFTTTGIKDGDTVSGDFTLQTDHSNVPNFEKYSYYVDDKLHNEEKNPIWCFNGDNGTSCNPYDSSQLTNGNHSLRIVMHYDGAQAEKTINFSIDNTSTPPPNEEPTSSGFGPDGTHWPSNTPAYDTPATTTITSLSQLNSALASASSGDVIEVAPQTYSSALSITDGKSSWAKNVLVRPQLGKRQSVVMNAEIAINSPNVTVAGLKVNSIFRGNRGANRSNFARIVMGANTAGYITDTVGFGLYEIVAPDYGVGGDRLQVRSTSSSYPTKNTVVAGCWLAGKWRYVGGTDHNDTYQQFGNSGGTVNDTLLIDNVFLASGDKAIQTGNTYNFILRNNYIQEPSASSASIPSGQEKYGYHAITGGGYNPESYDNIVAGSVSSTVPWDVVHNTKAQSWSTIIDSKSNTFSAGYNPTPPALANLGTIWD